MEEIYEYEANTKSEFFADSLEVIRKKNRFLLLELTEWILNSDYQSADGAYQTLKTTKYSVQGYMEALDMEEDIKGKVFDAGYVSALTDLMILFERGTLLHKELASELGVSSSALNAIIKLMNFTSVKVIKAERCSKYKWYSLTPLAYKYVKEKKKRQEYPNEKKTSEIY